jgi:hypothetical protein
MRDEFFLTAKMLDPHVFDNATQLRSKLSEIQMRVANSKSALEDATIGVAHFSAVLNLKEPLLAAGLASATVGCIVSPVNRARDEFFLKRQIASIILPHSKAIGFAYGVLDNGVKYAHIVIAGKGVVEVFDFALSVPGPAFVGTNIRANSIYPDKKIEELDLGSLRTTFENQGCKLKMAPATGRGTLVPFREKLRCCSSGLVLGHFLQIRMNNHVA